MDAKSKGWIGAIVDYESLRSYYTVKAQYNYSVGNTEQGLLALEQSTIYSDSMYFERKELDAKRVEAQFQTKLKEDAIQILELNNLKQASIVQSQRKGLFGFLIISILAGLLAFYYWRFNKAQKQINLLLNEEKKQLETENTDLIFQKEDLLKLNRDLKGQIHSISLVNKNLSPGRLELQGVNKIHFVNPLDITYISAEDDGVRLYTLGESIWIASTFKDVHKKLPEHQFLKIYRSTVINISFLEWVNHATLRLNEGTELKIGRTYKDDILKRFKK